ncbi:MAG: hypothetical protein M3Y37_02810 [Chloroflexota bacterium]|nr:hypothetical protein [Chloroflexota bacterium]
MPAINPKAAVLAGTTAGSAYVLCQEIDNRLSGQNLDDLVLLGRPFVDDPGKAKLAGVPIHLFNSVALASLFPIVRRVLPGGRVTQGISFALIENTVLYPVAVLENMHPAVRNGEVDRYFSLKAFLLSLPRHVAYGATLGLLYDRFAER